MIPAKFLQVAESVLSGQVEDGNGLLPSDALKAVEEFFQGLAGGQGIEEVLQWDACSVKARHAADAVGVDPGMQGRSLRRSPNIGAGGV